MKAQNVDDVYNNFRNEPLAMDRFDELFVNTDKGRGGLPAYHSLQRQLVKARFGSLNFLFAGHRGCGKSAELTRLQRDIQEQFVVINFSIREELDIQNINYIELFIVTWEDVHPVVKMILNEKGMLSDSTLITLKQTSCALAIKCRVGTHPLKGKSREKTPLLLKIWHFF